MKLQRSNAITALLQSCGGDWRADSLATQTLGLPGFWKTSRRRRAPTICLPAHGGGPLTPWGQAKKHGEKRVSPLGLFHTPTGWIR